VARAQRRESPPEEGRPVAAPACLVPEWLDQLLSQNTATPMEAAPATAPTRPRAKLPSPVADQLRALIQAHPEYTTARLMQQTGCSESYVCRIRRQLGEERGA
jgi:AraC-like DNA-binding protein